MRESIAVLICSVFWSYAWMGEVMSLLLRFDLNDFQLTSLKL